MVDEQTEKMGNGAHKRLFSMIANNHMGTVYVFVIILIGKSEVML